MKQKSSRGLLIAPLLIAVVSLPLALGMIEPNPFYGVRTAATAASEAAWYRGNQAGGIAGVLGGIAAAVATGVLMKSNLSQTAKLATWAAMLVGAAALIGIAGVLAA